MRQLHTHEVDKVNDGLKVTVEDEPGPGGANHVYCLYSDKTEQWLRFQNGPIKENGVNGITHEALLAVLIDRLEGFQKGPFASVYNATALHSLRDALDTLQQRTRERRERGVEGTLQI